MPPLVPLRCARPFRSGHREQREAVPAVEEHRYVVSLENDEVRRPFDRRIDSRRVRDGPPLTPERAAESGYDRAHGRLLLRALHASPSAAPPTTSSGSTRCSRASTSRVSPTRCASCSRTCSARRPTARSPPTRSRRSRAGSPPPSRRRRSPSRPRACCCRTSPASPAVVDLAAMRDAMRALGGDPERINPLIPAELVIDHSVQVDAFASRMAMATNTELEFERNRERYAFLRWGQTAFDNFKVVPPNTGICHQVNLEYLARVVEARDGWAFPDTLVGTDSHTTMVNGLGVLGWGVGGIEAEAAMLGESLSMLVPQVVGFRLSGALPGRGDRDRPRADRDARSCARSASSGSSSSTSATGSQDCPSRTAPRSRTCPRSTARRAGSSPSTTRRSATCASPAAPRSGSSSSRRTPRRTCSGTRPRRSRPTRASSSSTSARSSRASPGPRRPQDRVPLASAKSAFVDGLPGFGVDYTNGDEGVEETFPASDPTAEQAPGSEPTSVPLEPVAVAAPPRPRVVTVSAGGEEFELEPRRRRDRGDHVLHEHVQPVRDGRRGAAREERRRARPDGEAVGEDEPRARVEGRHGVLRARRAHRVPGRARLQHRRLRLHDLHRELRAAAGGDLPGGRRRTTSSSAPSSRGTATSRRGSIPR